MGKARKRAAAHKRKTTAERMAKLRGQGDSTLGLPSVLDISEDWLYLRAYQYRSDFDWSGGLHQR